MDSVVLTIMSDGSLAATGPEPNASELRSSVESYFAILGISSHEERVAALNRILEQIEGAPLFSVIQ